jgi:hypothetical protein
MAVLRNKVCHKGPRISGHWRYPRKYGSTES